ncbi:MAG TPA: hypothetical protein VL242_13315 [Sorangium sp.]|nr:hypothetical protein [Sorangium sp.]
MMFTIRTDFFPDAARSISNLKFRHHTIAKANALALSVPRAARRWERPSRWRGVRRLLVCRRARFAAGRRLDVRRAGAMSRECAREMRASEEGT